MICQTTHSEQQPTLDSVGSWGVVLLRWVKGAQSVFWVHSHLDEGHSIPPNVKRALDWLFFKAFLAQTTHNLLPG